MKKILNNKDLGALGEKTAKKYLKKKGLKFIKQNFKYHNKEVDLIFADKKNKILIFTEVKTRHESIYFSPEDSINYKKIANYRFCVQGFLMRNPGYNDYDIRIDSIGITIINSEFNINHTENLQ
ncbi:MAG: YraN family protein [Ignavibacteria bacterium]|nr:YraN family protein [Ignavibacteria bacterium]